MVFIKTWFLIGFYSIACMGMGRLAFLLLSTMFRSKSRIAQNVIVQYSANMIVGIGILGTFWTFISLASLFSPIILLLTLLPLFLFGIWQIYQDRICLCNDFKRIFICVRQVNWIYKLVGFGCIYYIFVMISSQLKVDPGDASAYYFALAKVISSSHTLKVLPGYYFSSFPSEAIMALGLHGELHMAALYSLGTDHYARYFDIQMLAASIVVLLGFLSMAGVKVKGLFLATLIFLLTSAITSITAIGKVDIYGITFTLGAIYFAGLFFQTKERSFVALSGFLIGIAVTTKLSYLVNMVPAVGVLLLWHTIFVNFIENRRNFLSNFKSYAVKSLGIIFLLSISLLLSMVSYFAKNHFVLGNIAAPFMLPDNVVNAISILFPPNTINKVLLTYPLSLSFFKIPANPGQFPPLLLAFLPNLYFARKNIKFDSLATSSFFAGLFGILIWIIIFPGVPFVRYLFAALVLLLPLVIWATEHVLDVVESKGLKNAIQASIVLSTVFGLINPGMVGNQIQLVNNYMNREIPRCNVPQCQQDLAINDDAAEGDRLLNLSDFRFWLRSDLIECSATTQETNEILFLDQSKYWEAAYQRGIKYVSLNLSSKGLEDPIAWSAPEWIQIKTIYRENDLIVYRLDIDSAPYTPSRRCVQEKPPAWDVIEGK